MFSSGLVCVQVCIVDIVEPQNKGHYGPTILSLVERLSYLKGRIMLVGLKYVYFVERSSLSRLVTYLRFHCTPLQSSVESFPYLEHLNKMRLKVKAMFEELY